MTLEDEIEARIDSLVNNPDWLDDGPDEELTDDEVQLLLAFRRLSLQQRLDVLRNSYRLLGSTCT